MRPPSYVTVASCGFQLMMFGGRKPSLTPDEYRDFYENVHIPFMLNLTGDTFPLTHQRHYVERDASSPPDYPAQLLAGTQADFTYDAVAVLTYRDRAHFDANWKFFEDPGTFRLIKENEEMFSAWTTGVFIDSAATRTGDRDLSC